MKLNRNKTKVQATTNEEEELDIYVKSTKIEQVNYLNYLGVVLQKDVNQELEINDMEKKTLKLYHAINRNFRR